MLFSSMMLFYIYNDAKQSIQTSFAALTLCVKG